MRIKKSKVKIKRNFRTAKKNKPYEEPFVFVFSSLGCFILLTLTTININKTLYPKKPEIKTVLAQSYSIDDEKQFWVEFLAKSPEYVPGLLELAKIENSLGNKDNALKLFLRAKLINPNDNKVIEAKSFFKEEKLF